jgi:hypothetical protein
MKKVLFVALTLALSFTVSVRAHAFDTCKNVKFTIANNFKDSGSAKRTIRVKKIEYFNDHSNDWKTEDVKNFEIKYGKKRTTKGDNLSNILGEDVSKIKVIFDYKEGDDQYSKDGNSGEIAMPGDRDCKADKTFPTSGELSVTKWKD